MLRNISYRLKIVVDYLLFVDGWNFDISGLFIEKILKSSANFTYIFLVFRKNVILALTIDFFHPSVFVLKNSENEWTGI